MALPAVTKPYRTAVPTLANPTITDAPIAVIGISRDRKTLIGGSVAAPYQLYYSTDDAATWSAALLTTAESNQIYGAVETINGELFLSYNSGRFLARTGGWSSRTMAGGGMTATSAISLRTSGIFARPQWSIDCSSEFVLACEYGAKTNSPLTNNARYAYLSKNEQHFVTIFDLQSNTVGDAGLGITPVSGAYHLHAIAYDKWDNRIWISGGDNNDFIVYSDDAADLEVLSDLATTNASTTVTVASTTTTTFTSRHVGAPIRGAGIPAGTTIASVTDYRTVVLSAAATATASGVVASLGTLTWKVFHYGRSGRFQVTSIMPAPEGVYFGADGFPTGVHFSQRTRRGAPGKLENVLLTAAYSTGTGKHLAMGVFRASDALDSPVIFSGVPNDTTVGGFIAIAHPNGRRIWKVWDDSRQVAFEGPVQVFHTYSGKLIASLQSARTSSGWQILSAPMPALPSGSAL